MIGHRGLACLLAFLAPCAAEARNVYVASQGAGTLVALVPGSSVGGASLAVARSPAQIAAGPDGRLYLTHPDAGQVTAVDEASGTISRTFVVPGQPFGIAVSADGADLFVGDWAQDRVMRLSAETGALTGVVAVGRSPAGLVLDRRGRLYVADRESRQVSVIDTDRMERVATVAVGEAPFALAMSAAQDRLYVANVRSGDLSVVDMAALRTVATFAVGGTPYGVVVGADDRRILVTNQQAGTLVILDATEGAKCAVVPVGRYPEGVVIAGSQAYVANWFSDSVSIVDLTTARETARIAVPDGPRSLVVSHGTEGR